MNFKIEIEDNSKKYLDKLDQCELKIYEEWGKAFKRLVNKVMTRDKIIDTGHLKRSMTYNPPTNEGVEVGTVVTYGIYVHEGTSKMAGRPFIKNSIIPYKDTYQKITTRILKNT